MPREPTIVVVDDEPDVREWLRVALGLEGWQVLEAADGESALAQLQWLEPDVVIMDHRMQGMSGLELAAALRELPTSAQLLLFSASVERHDLDRAHDLAVHPVSKVDHNALFQLLKVLQEEARSRRFGAT